MSFNKNCYKYYATVVIITLLPSYLFVTTVTQTIVVKLILLIVTSL